jgi:hypothetical protein
MKFFIVIFIISSPGEFSVKGQRTVETQELCVAEAYEINSDESIPFNAACIPVRNGERT